MTDNFPKQKEYTVSILKIYAFSLFLLIPLTLLFILPYHLIWNHSLSEFLKLLFSKIKNNWDNLFTYLNLLRQIFIFSLVILAGAVFHELLHAVVWVLFTKKGIKSIRFGVSKTDFSPYVHCKEPLPAWIYRMGTLTPGLILGILPSVISIFTGSLGCLLFGVFFTWAASGDFLILWIIRNVNKYVLLQDHPVKVGCVVMD